MLNKVFLIGRLGKDPVIKHFPNDGAIGEFSLATTESYKDKEGKWVDVTDWHNIKLPNKFMAERAEKNLKKGSLVHIEGKVRNRSYDDKDGNKRYITEIIAEQFKQLDRKAEGGSQEGGGADNYASNTNTSGSNNYAQNETTTANNSAADDDLPF